MRTWTRRAVVVTVAGALIAAALQGCASLPKHPEDTLRISRKGVTVLVDSSLTDQQHGSRLWISVPDNGSIAVEAEKAAESVLTSKGYKLDQPSLVTVGAWFEPSEKMRVQTASQELETPAAISKPFVVWPGVSGEPMKAKINDLFAWTHRTPQGDPRPSMDFSQSEGVLLLSSWGSMADRKAGVQFILLDRATGKIAWWAQGGVTSKTPESFAKEVRSLLAELPVEQGQGKK